MLSRPSLSQSKQPKGYYDYDGLSGGWLWFPWWIHLILAIVVWPICWWLLPMLPFQNGNISYFLLNYRLELAIVLSISNCVTAIMSVLKAKQVKLKKIKTSKTPAMAENLRQKEKKPAKTKVVGKDVKRTMNKVPKKTSKKSETLTEVTVSKKKKAKTAVKSKKDDNQLRLDF